MLGKGQKEGTCSMSSYVRPMSVSLSESNSTKSSKLSTPCGLCLLMNRKIAIDSRLVIV